jgi:cytochrome b561
MSFRYGPAARWLHWLTALLVLAMFALGIWIVEFEPKDHDFKLRVYNVHESLGVTIFMVVVLRLVIRRGNPPAPLPADLPPLIRLAARANHALLYAALLAQPVIGLLDTNAWGFPLKWFGLFPIPSPIGKQPEDTAKLLSAAHFWVAILLVCLIALHLAGVAYHAFIRRDRVLSRMI